MERELALSIGSRVLNRSSIRWRKERRERAHNRLRSQHEDEEIFHANFPKSLFERQLHVPERVLEQNWRKKSTAREQRTVKRWLAWMWKSWARARCLPTLPSSDSTLTSFSCQFFLCSTESRLHAGVALRRATHQRESGACFNKNLSEGYKTLIYVLRMDSMLSLPLCSGCSGLLEQKLYVVNFSLLFSLAEHFCFIVGLWLSRILNGTSSDPRPRLEKHGNCFWDRMRSFSFDFASRWKTNESFFVRGRRLQGVPWEWRRGHFWDWFLKIFIQTRNLFWAFLIISGKKLSLELSTVSTLW